LKGSGPRVNVPEYSIFQERPPVYDAGRYPAL